MSIRIIFYAFYNGEAASAASGHRRKGTNSFEVFQAAHGAYGTAEVGGEGPVWFNDFAAKRT